MEIDRTKRPPASGEINFSPPEFSRHKLTNGVELYLIRKADLPIIRLNLLVQCGSKFDPQGKYGTSNLLSMCIDEGAGNYDALQLSDEFEFLGVRFFVYSDHDTMMFSLQVLDENFDKALKLFSLVVHSPLLNEEDFGREKRKIQTRIKQLKDDPEFIADTSFEYFLFGRKNPYAFPVIGTGNNLQAVTIADIRSFYKNFFNPGTAAIVAAGNFNEDDFLRKLNEAFRDWHRVGKHSDEIIPSGNYGKKVYIVHKRDSVQTEVRIGHPAARRNSEDYFQKQLLNLILGGQFSSRLNLNLREKHGFTYGIHSAFNYYKDDAYFYVSTSVNTGNTADALGEIFKELTKIRQGVTEEELDFAKSSMTRKFPLNFETIPQIASNFSSKIIHNLPDDYFDSFIQNVLRININDVNSVAPKSIDPDLAITVLAGDEKKISEQISKSDFEEVIKLNYDEIFSG